MNKTKKIILLTSLVLLAVSIVGGTLAFLLDTAGPVENTFEPTYVPIEVEEDFDGETKKDVTIRNTGNIPAYIRATYVVNWADEDGNIWGTPPVEGEDYTIEINFADWKQNPSDKDAYYYYTSAVAANSGETTNFINICSLKENVMPPKDADGSEYYLRVDILAQSVQSEPDDAVLDLWGVDPTTLGK